MAITLNPDTGPTAGGNLVAISGTALTTANKVTFGLTTIPSGSITHFTASGVGVSAPAGTGVVPVTITTAGGTSAPANYFYIAQPIKTGISPSSGPEGGGTAVTITGQNLSGATAINFGPGNPGTGLSSTAGSASVTSPAGTGSVPVTVTTPGGTVDGLYFNYCAAPALTAVNPTAGPETGGNALAVTGTGGLTGTSAVTVGGVASPFVVISDTEVDVIAPAGTGGPVDIVVTACGGSDTLAASYTYVPGP